MTARVPRVLLVQPRVDQDLLRSVLTAAEEVVLLVPSGTAAGPPWPDDLTRRVRVHHYADTFHAVKLASELHDAVPFDALFTSWEGAVETTAAITEALELPGCSPESARTARDKSLAAARFALKGVPHPRGIAFDANAPEAAHALLDRCGERGIVVKIPRSTNSQSVLRVRSHSALDDALSVIRGLYHSSRSENRLADLYAPVTVSGSPTSRAEPVLAQEYVSGAEVNIDLLLNENEHAVLGVFEKYPATGPTFGETQSVWPTSLSVRDLDRAVRTAVAAARALGLTRGAVHAELRVADGQATVIEASPRLGGFLTPLAVRRLTGVDPLAALTRLMADGELPVMPSVRTDQACLYGAANVEQAGRIVRITGAETARNLPGVQFLDVIKEPGDILVPLPEGTDYHIAAFLLEGSGREELLSLAEEVRRCLVAELEEVDR